MKKFLLLFAFVAGFILFPVPVNADDAVRSAQGQLRDSGYYTGPVDGELNAETKAALRRYQIRNELEPTGELTAETVAALNNEKPNAPTTPAATPVPPPVSTPAPDVAPPSAARGIPVPPMNPEPDIYAEFFARTPYAEASREVKFETVRKLQEKLASRGLYNGSINGRPGPATEEALIRFQAQRGLSRTGRLDIDTLAELHLLPVTKLRKPQVLPEPYTPVPPTRNRGIPLD